MRDAKHDSRGSMTLPPDSAYTSAPFLVRDSGRRGSRAGRRVKCNADSRRGSYVRSRTPHGKIADVALDSTIRSAVSRPKLKQEGGGLAVGISTEDIRVKVRRRKHGASVVFVLDSSGSMGVNRRMAAVKGAILSMLEDAYQRRDRIGLVAFRGEGAEVVLEITRSVDLAERKLAEIPTGGRTPLLHGLSVAQEILLKEKSSRPDSVLVMVLISDGRANVSGDGKSDPAGELMNFCTAWTPEECTRIVIDTETGLLRHGMARKISEWLGAVYFKLEDLSSEGIVRIVSTYLR